MRNISAAEYHLLMSCQKLQHLLNPNDPNIPYALVLIVVKTVFSASPNRVMINMLRSGLFRREQHHPIDKNGSIRIVGLDSIRRDQINGRDVYRIGETGLGNLVAHWRRGAREFNDRHVRMSPRELASYAQEQKIMQTIDRRIQEEIATTGLATGERTGAKKPVMAFTLANIAFLQRVKGSADGCMNPIPPQAIDEVLSLCGYGSPYQTRNKWRRSGLLVQTESGSSTWRLSAEGMRHVDRDKVDPTISQEHALAILSRARAQMASKEVPRRRQTNAEKSARVNGVLKDILLVLKLLGNGRVLPANSRYLKRVFKIHGYVNPPKELTSAKARGLLDSERIHGSRNQLWSLTEEALSRVAAREVPSARLTEESARALIQSVIGKRAASNLLAASK